jgi:uncharacterized protein YjiS (DUF1127 family)
MNTSLENRLNLVAPAFGRAPASVAILRAVEKGLRALAGHVGRFAAAWQRCSEATAVAQALGELDDHMLRDLGIHRSEQLGLARDPRDVTRARLAWQW